MNTTIILRGHVGADPTLNVASTSRRKEGDEWVDGPTTWVRVVSWKRTAEGVAEKVTKGTEVLCVGRLDTEEWTDKDGEARSTLTCTAETVAVVVKPPAGATPRAQDDPPF